MGSAMDSDDSHRRPWDRRSILQMAAVCGGLGVTPSAVSGRETRNRATSDVDDQEWNALGTFESSLDGWRTNGGNELERVTADEFPAGVVEGRHALATHVNGDTFPMIENSRRVADADFLSSSHLKAQVFARAEDTDSDVVFQFLLHHTQAGGDRGAVAARGRGRAGGSSVRESPNVERSDPITVPQYGPRTIEWDMTALPDQVLETANRLEIAWYLEEHEPVDGRRGRGRGAFEYEGITLFDDVRIVDAPSLSGPQRERNKRLDLHREHGKIVERLIEERAEDYERGILVYADETEVPFEEAILEDGRERVTIDGETFEYGGGDGE